jgi:hypothetical protein
VSPYEQPRRQGAPDPAFWFDEQQRQEAFCGKGVRDVRRNGDNLPANLIGSRLQTEVAPQTDDDLDRVMRVELSLLAFAAGRRRGVDQP